MPQVTYPPFSVFFGLDGDPLDDGYVYIGEADENPETNPLQAYWDAALTTPAPQPFRTVGGYLSRSGTPANAYTTPTNYSITVKDSAGRLVYTSLSEALISGGGTAADYIAGDGTIKNFGTAVRGTVLTGLSLASAAAILATDTVLSAFGKLQAQLGAVQPTIAAGTTAQYWRGDKTFQDLFTQVREATLSGLSLASAAAVTSADTVLAAIGKLQAQISRKSLGAGAVNSAGTLTAGYGVASVTRPATGQYTITLSTALSSAANGACLVTANDASASSLSASYEITSTTVVNVRMKVNGTDPAPINVAFGFQILELG